MRADSPPAVDSAEPFVWDAGAEEFEYAIDREYPWIAVVANGGEADGPAWLERGADAWVADTASEGELALRLRQAVDDATARRRAMRRHRAAERLFRAMVENALDVITLLDEMGEILYESPSIRSMLGYDPKGVIGRNAIEFVHPGDRARILQLLVEGRARQRDTATIQYRFRHRDGSYRTVESRAMNLLGRPGIDAIVVVTRDMSERIAVEQRLRSSENRFRTLFEQSPDAIFIESHDQRVLDVNPQACRLHEADREWLLGMSVPDLVPERFRHQFAIEFPLLVDGLMNRGEGWSLARTGREIPIEYSVGHIVWGDEPALLLHVRDVGQRRATEAMLRQLGSHQQARIEDERARISRDVHDVLGQSLTALKFDMVSFARMQDSSERTQELERILYDIDRTLDLVRRIASDLRPGILDDLGLAAAVEWLARRFSERTGLACAVMADGDDLTVDGERSIVLFRVVQELLTNVARHARATSAVVRIVRREESTRIEVEDDGIGFDPGAIPDSGHLGLFGIRERLGPWGGTVQYEPNEPHGTRAIVTMPS